MKSEITKFDDGSWEESYYINGLRHREDGPARIQYDKNGKVMTNNSTEI